MRAQLCFARALLQEARVFVLDEATSNLDGASDRALQALLRSEFSRYTVLTIAHRLHTVIDYDKILVMGGGRLVESGRPHELLATAGGALASMAAALGESGEAELREQALRAGRAKEGPAALLEGEVKLEVQAP